MTLQEYLLKYRINHDDFAKMIGVSRKTLYFIAKGKIDPRLSTVRKIEVATNGMVTASDLQIREVKDI